MGQEGEPVIYRDSTPGAGGGLGVSFGLSGNRSAGILPLLFG